LKDTIKTRLQIQAINPITLQEMNHVKYNGPIDCFKRILKIEGARSFYSAIKSNFQNKKSNRVKIDP
jgi:hypothetical protein